MNKTPGYILIVDDNLKNIQILGQHLQERGYEIAVATNGEEAIDWSEKDSFDLILLDIMMPGIDGYQVCKKLKSNERSKETPIIFLTAKTDIDSIITGLNLGAVDYVTKPFNHSELLARVKTHIELKKAKEELTFLNDMLLIEKGKSDKLLLNILPEKVAHDLKEDGYTTPEKYDNVTVFFSDFINFTDRSSKINPRLLIDELNDIFTSFDEIMEKNSCERIKTIGDAYLSVCGLPKPDDNHVINIIDSAIEIIDYLKQRNASKPNGLTWQMRIGIHSGEVVAGVVGRKKFIYDVFGDTVNTASRMETNGESMKINISETTHSLLNEKYIDAILPYIFEERPSVQIKGKGNCNMYFLTKR